MTQFFNRLSVVKIYKLSFLEKFGIQVKEEREGGFLTSSQKKVSDIGVAEFLVDGEATRNKTKPYCFF